ncbi:Lsb5p Ecym_1045 [Eremothecium cymbalariae DBVPG|uniref:VHS domain-containing protein n=1 Tax=Eremothecium cymbalariae (strain CBS 270.75 / DBVPG 7215 / KCTC 17166 / NRRL Y-17582) TaxID=931890 RepID=G8JM43_ERECY|nr:hypothetical protein Ecym_1045 [Eremothecium cymbalariae DBVPG\
MGFLSDHQHTLITDIIDRVVSIETVTLEVELERLVQLIRSESEYESTNNQLEAARAMRKQLKYGNQVQQSRALDLLNLFVSQLIRFSVIYNDVKLLQRLQGIAMETETDSRGRSYHKKVVKQAVGYLLAWTSFIRTQAPDSRSYDGLLRLGDMVKRNYVKKTERSRQRHSYTIESGGKSTKKGAFIEDCADTTTNLDDELYHIPHINIANEASNIKLLISDALATAISLKNSLLELPKGKKSIDDAHATAKFTEARELRKRVLRYLQLITEGELLGPLIHANEELVNALSRYDELADDNHDDRLDNDSLSSDDLSERESNSTDNPFGDQNKI